MTARVGILLVTHGAVGGAMLSSVESLLGAAALAGFETLEVGSGEARDITATRVAEAVARLDQGAGVLVVSDLHGSTPANCAQALGQAGTHVTVLCGVNLPMLVKLATMDRAGVTPEALARVAAETAIRSIRLANGKAP